MVDEFKGCTGKKMEKIAFEREKVTCFKVFRRYTQKRNTLITMSFFNLFVLWTAYVSLQNGSFLSLLINTKVKEKIG